mmetsp:Transcript_116930/g.233034  ORF Transcript_116930/g.233034 Transcript_116930/m.233034 type:complete len:362 (-) Transcript_116930:121-1206(-)
MAEGTDAYALQRTNSLRVDFPAGQATSVSVATAYQELAAFGDVARIEVPSGSGSVAIVSFYDVRAVDRVLEVLGDRCMVAPEFGNRVVVLQGEEQLQEWMLPDIETVQYDSHNAAYCVFFFDTRVAERVAGKLRSHHVQQRQQQKELLHHVSHGEASGDITQAPRYRNDLRLSQVNWGDLASGRDKRTTLQLRCLPAQLCNEMELANILERVRLLHYVNCIRAFPGTGKRLGSALINAGDAAGAAAIAKYFHGRQWGRSLPVSVSFAAVQSLEDIYSTFPPSLPGPRGLAKPFDRAEPRRVDLAPMPKCSSITGISEDPGTSEVSTEVGDDAELLACLTEGPDAVAVVSQPQWASTLAKAS